MRWLGWIFCIDVFGGVQWQRGVPADAGLVTLPDKAASCLRQATNDAEFEGIDLDKAGRVGVECSSETVVCVASAGQSGNVVALCARSFSDAGRWW